MKSESIYLSIADILRSFFNSEEFGTVISDATDSYFRNESKMGPEFRFSEIYHSKYWYDKYISVLRKNDWGKRPDGTLETRHIAIVLSADGVSPFDMNVVSFWVMAAAILNLPSHLRYTMRYMILAGITPLIRKPKDKEVYKRTKNKFSLNSFLCPIVDELKALFLEGFAVEDFSQPDDSPLRHFRCRVILLSTPMDHKAAVKVPDLMSRERMCKGVDGHSILWCAVLRDS